MAPGVYGTTAGNTCYYDTCTTTYTAADNYTIYTDTSTACDTYVSQIVYYPIDWSQVRYEFKPATNRHVERREWVAVDEQPPPLNNEEDCRRFIEYAQGHGRDMREQAERKAKIEREARAVAEQKGDKLLRDILGEADFALFKKQQYIDILSATDPNKKYRVRASRRIGIVKLENGQWREKALSLCIHPESHWEYVVGDLVATHVLLAKFDEPTLNRVANLHQMAA